MISGITVVCGVYGGGNNAIQGNFIGTDVSGTLRRGAVYGVYLAGSTNNLIGGSNAGEGNLISGNGDGVVATGVSANNNVVAGNLIGTDVTGANSLGNLYYGVLIEGAGNLIGGTNSGAGNVISGNDGFGVTVAGADSTNNAVLGNSIFANGALGLDLYAGGGVNDPGDADSGPNQFQNYPELTNVFAGGGLMRLDCRVDSTASASAYPLTIEVFLADSSESGQGRTLIHRATYLTPQVLTNILFSPLSSVSPTNYIVATATDANGNTSEFSAAVAVNTLGQVSLTVTSSGELVTITWPASALGFILESADNLSPPVTWQSVTNRITESGGLYRFVVTNSLAEPGRFFRLRSP